MGKLGRERRRRFVYVTKNREYHIFDTTCIAVRDRKSGSWVDDHAALRHHLEGGVKIYSTGAAVPTLQGPEVGQPMFFHVSEDRGDIITSRVMGVERPRLEDLVRYPAA